MSAVYDPTTDSLKTLYTAMVALDPRTVDAHGDWRTDLPTFGDTGSPATTDGVWSWNDLEVIVGTCAEDLEIWTREELAASIDWDFAEVTR